MEMRSGNIVPNRRTEDNRDSGLQGIVPIPPVSLSDPITPLARPLPSVSVSAAPAHSVDPLHPLLGTTPSFRRDKKDVPAKPIQDTLSLQDFRGTPRHMSWDYTGTSTTTPVNNLRDEFHISDASHDRNNQLSPATSKEPATSNQISRSSSFIDITSSEVDFQKVQSSLEQISLQLIQSQNSVEQLHKFHDTLIDMHSSLRSHQINFPNMDTHMVEALLNKVSTLKADVNNLRFGQGVSAPTDFIPTSDHAIPQQVDISRIIETKLDQVHNDLSQQVHDYLASSEARLILSVTNNICDEYNHVQVRCVSTKGELKRGVTALRQDLSNVLGELKKIEARSIQANNSVASALQHSSETARRVNEKLDHFDSQFNSTNTSISEFSQTIDCCTVKTSSLDQRLSKLESIVNDFIRNFCFFFY